MKPIFVFVKMDGKMKLVTNVSHIGVVPIKAMMLVKSQMNVYAQKV